MASVYPGALDSLATNKANTTNLPNDHPTHHNDLADAINKIEAELGIAPSDRFATVKARLDGLVFNVKDAPYNAVWDGAADDTAAVQAAAAAVPASGGTVLLPEGTGLISARIQWKANTLVLGRGKGATVVKLKNSANISQSIFETDGTHIIFRDFTLDGNKANQTSGASALVPVNNNCTVQNVRVINSWDRSIYSFAAADLLIDGCEVESAGAAGGSVKVGIGVWNGTRSRVVNNRVDGALEQGIYLGGTGTRAVIANNIIKDCGLEGIALGSGNQFVAVTGNHITQTDTAANCIDTGSCFDVTVSGNVCNGGRVGIECDTGYRQTIVGNTCLNPNLGGINASGPAGVTKDLNISGNIISGAGGDGMALDSITNSTVSGNVVKNSARVTAGKNGIGLYATNANPSGLIVTGNRCYDDQGTKTQAYGLKVLSGTPTDLTIIGNDFRGNLTDTMLLAGTTHLVKDNLGIGMPTVASATTIAVPNGADITSVTGTTTITSVTAGFAGQRVKLVFAGVLTFTDGSNLKLAGNFVTTADDSIVLTCDGTNWNEDSRSVN